MLVPLGQFWGRPTAPTKPAENHQLKGEFQRLISKANSNGEFPTNCKKHAQCTKVNFKGEYQWRNRKVNFRTGRKKLQKSAQCKCKSECEMILSKLNFRGEFGRCNFVKAKTTYKSPPNENWKVVWKGNVKGRFQRRTRLVDFHIDRNKTTKSRSMQIERWVRK